MSKRVYDIKVERYDGSTYFLEEYKGKVLIIVNTATNCALNDQFEGLETLYQKYKNEGTSKKMKLNELNPQRIGIPSAFQRRKKN